jgi:hypothetical protein
MPRPHPCSLSALVLLLASIAPGLALAAWPTNSAVNVPVNTVPSSKSDAVMAPDSCGGGIVVWRDGRDGVEQLYAQRVDAFGQLRWDPNGVHVAPSSSGQYYFSVAPDGAGGCFIAWTESRISGSGNDVFLQHLLASGAPHPMFPPDGVIVCGNSSNQYEPAVAFDGVDGAIVAWSDEGAPSDMRPDYYAQRITFAGTALWTPNGVPIASSPGVEGGLDIVGDGAGGAFAAWVDEPTGVADLYVQRLDALAGARQWGPVGLPVKQDAAQQSSPSVAFDGSRLLLVWIDTSNSPWGDVFAAAFGPLGTALWTPGGVPVTSAAPDLKFGLDLVPDGLGGLIAAWSDRRNGGVPLDAFAQRVDPSGVPAWAANGVALSTAPGDQIVNAIVTDGRGGAIVAWDDGRNLPASTDNVFAARVTHSGLVPWTANGAPVSTADSVQIYPVAVPDGAGGAVVAWVDSRGPTLNGLDIYAQQIGAGGTAGVRARSVGCQPDLCGYAYTDFGDAPENLPAFPSGSLGHYPTCKAASTAGTQEIECGSALSTPPGPTGWVEHAATFEDAKYVTFGCQAAPKWIGVDSETDGVVNVGAGPPPLMPTTSACDPGVLLQTFEPAFGLWFGGDDRAISQPGVALSANPVLHSCGNASMRLRTGACGPGDTPAYLNVLVDWNQDGDWNDVARCGTAAAGSCAPEWAVKNAPVTVRPGCDSLDTPVFRVGPATGGTWMRLTLTLAPVNDDFPWAGSATNPGPGGSASAPFAGGETEDYPVSVTEAVDVAEAPAAGEMMLAPVAPNPSGGTAVVRFALPQASNVRLGIYDLAGRRVRELVAGTRAAGTHTVRWDGHDASGTRVRAGLYFARLEVGDRKFVRTVVRTN